GRLWMPQWSPPLTGGSTPRGERLAGLLLDAAMEPAVDRREHRETECVNWLQRHLPQWSPPLTGGSTRTAALEARIRLTAAMEPAVDRREHGSQNSGRLSCADSPGCERSAEHGAGIR
ncbi:MAG: hypothetical protein ACRDRJ_40200, partial [Streptosporangiaceae bacterium]